MKKIKFFLTLALLLSTFLNYSQQRPEGKKVKVSGKIVEKVSSQPLEYATVSLVNTTTNKITAGGITDAKGEFNFDASPATYNVKVEFISFKPLEIKGKEIKDNTNLGTISLEDESTKLNEVIIRSEKTTVEIKLDKKVYNVGNDLMVKGGTVSDVLDNIPSVAVSAEGNISLRGNENVRILIDGKPSNAININDALRMLPADAIDKVEVITNPSARYDAEGGGGLLNIILKKGKTNGLNGVIIANTGYPDNHGLSGNLNYKTTEFNLFTTQGYNYRNNPGNSLVETEYLNASPTAPRFINETRDNDRINKGYNGNFGAEWFLDKNTTWTNTVNYRKTTGDNQDNVFFDRQFTNSSLNNIQSRINFEDGKSENVDFSSNLIRKFKKDGHKLTIDTQFSKNSDDNIATIIDSQEGTDATISIQRQNRNLIQADYVLPIGKSMQLEAGYRGDFSELDTDVTVFNEGVVNTLFTNNLVYKEKVNALYTQYGFKVSKFSVLLGMRWEDSNIDINQITTSDFNNKRYNNFFPSAFFTYEISDKTNASISYSKRIQRPRGRQINPFSNYSSNINIFQGNPDLDPAMTDAIDLGFLKSWEKVTLNTSLYVNKTTDSFQFVRRESGTFVNGIPVIVSSPINLATEYRAGFEFTLNYTPYKWWKLNSNFNFFRVETQGDFTYTNFQNTQVTQNFDNIASSWSTRLTSKITLPKKIDWQTNATYNGPQNNAQGRSLGVFAMNLAFSKDVLKDKGTVSLNVNDVFNSRKRIMETNIPNLINSYAEMQWRERQVTLSFTYRFNKPKNERDRQPKRNQDNDGGDFPG
ncbi:TonB-dependent receptor [Flavobacterium sp.]|uniref:TonB-dependent receptor domain-containing protein n=1 Tax=Flavobacterium sp. TaxID=239 RepID=UPI002618568E|nr:TonB-dependent receptor [Flavobacterium sp.]